MKSWSEFRKASPEEKRAYLELVDLKTFYERHPDQLVADRKAKQNATN